jgi:hypothetical protein
VVLKIFFIPCTFQYDFLLNSILEKVAFPTFIFAGNGRDHFAMVPAIPCPVLVVCARSGFHNVSIILFHSVLQTFQVIIAKRDFCEHSFPRPGSFTNMVP